MSRDHTANNAKRTETKTPECSNVYFVEHPTTTAATIRGNFQQIVAPTRFYTKTNCCCYENYINRS